MNSFTRVINDVVHHPAHRLFPLHQQRSVGLLEFVSILDTNTNNARPGVGISRSGLFTLCNRPGKIGPFNNRCHVIKQVYSIEQHRNGKSSAL